MLALVEISECVAQSSWKALPNAPIALSRFYDAFFVNPSTGWIVDIGGQIFKTRDGGQTWEFQFISPLAQFRSVGFADTLRGWAGTLSDDLLYQTNDGGATWLRVENLPDPKPAGICGISVVNASVIYACGRFEGPSHLIKTTDGGATWSSLDMSAHAGTLVDCHFFSPDSGFVVGGDPRGAFPSTTKAVVLFTADGGRNWQTRHTTNREGEWCWKISFASRRFGYVSIEDFMRRGFCLKTTDGGITWQEIAIPQTLVTEGIGFVNENKGWIGGPLATSYETSDGGLTWQPVAGMEDINRFRMFSDTLGYAVGQLVYKYSPDNTTAVNSSKTAQLPLDFGLEQNFPNPFNPTTSITYRIVQPGHVQLKVFDVSGQLIATLVNEAKPAGSYTRLGLKLQSLRGAFCRSNLLIFKGLLR
ncbi:YCF48-related protein [candidate division KSB1 bacterium]|nr:YCF48-related protein [candidate division KSB1 bacterium]